MTSGQLGRRHRRVVAGRRRRSRSTRCNENRWTAARRRIHRCVDAAARRRNSRRREPVQQRAHLSERRRTLYSVPRRRQGLGGISRARDFRTSTVQPRMVGRKEHEWLGRYAARRYERRRRPVRRSASGGNAPCSTSTARDTRISARSTCEDRNASATNAAAAAKRGRAVSRDGKTRRVSVQRFHPSGRRVRRERARRHAAPADERQRCVSGIGDALDAARVFGQRSRPVVTVQAWFMPAIGGKPGQAPDAARTFTAVPKRSSATRFSSSFSIYAGARLQRRLLAIRPAAPATDTRLRGARKRLRRRNVPRRRIGHGCGRASGREVDPSRVWASLGGSYGGYATLWVISHTNRYKAAVAERVVSYLQSENLGADFAGKGGLAGGQYSMGPAVGSGEHRAMRSSRR